ncbi:putative Calpain-type cysteine protease DEK1 [Paratrimastix pyriformis]|uniref:Calpain-type cysteine protease DEK1 n=1 Tax=Paratrimastix pyriformis TaxID=342808 RepID=A0ABQ8U7L3_9EUKA|nr:putative Calpain-type cysteine protease DEK1 [Paratrimastix pyriformis]
MHPAHPAAPQLHGHYQALVGGTVMDALVDMTGGVSSRHALPPRPSELGALWALLLQTAAGQVMMGCSCSDRRQSAGSGAPLPAPDDDGDDDIAAATGLVGRHAYAILQAVETRPDAGAPRGRRLVQICNPWGRRVWRGAWDRDDPRWTEALRVQAPEGPPGTFWMELADVCAHFDAISACTIWDDRLPFATSIRGAWRGPQAAGPLSGPLGKFLPQYELVFTGPPAGGAGEAPTARLVAALMRRDPRGRAGRGAAALGGEEAAGREEEHMSLALVRHERPRGERVVGYDADMDLAGRGARSYTNSREVTLEATLDTDGRYMLVPATLRVGAELPYALRVFSDRPYAIRPVPFEAAWQEATIEGEWAPLQAEGLPSSQGAWWENPQFLLSLLTQEGLPPTEVPVQVCLEPFYTHAIDPAGRYRLLPGLDAEGNHPTPYYYDLVCLPATPAAQEVEGDEGPADGPIYRTCTYKPLIPPTFTNAPENVRQLSLRAGGSAILMPTTYGARQYGRFRLTVLCPVGTPVALQLQPVPEWPHRTALWGAWTGPTAAGCPNSGTAFWRNPTFRLRLQGGRRARVVLCQHAPGDREAREGLARLSPAEGRALVPLAPPANDPPADEGDAGPELQSIGLVLADPRTREILCRPPSWTNGAAVTLVVEAEPDRDYLLIPSTFDPGQEGLFRLVVFSQCPHILTGPQ